MIQQRRSLTGTSDTARSVRYDRREERRAGGGIVINVADLYPSYLDFDDKPFTFYLFLPIQKCVNYGYFVIVDGCAFLLKQWSLMCQVRLTMIANLRNLLNLEKLTNGWITPTSLMQ